MQAIAAERTVTGNTAAERHRLLTVSRFKWDEKFSRQPKEGAAFKVRGRKTKMEERGNRNKYVCNL